MVGTLVELLLLPAPLLLLLTLLLAELVLAGLLELEEPTLPIALLFVVPVAARWALEPWPEPYAAWHLAAMCNDDVLMCALTQKLRCLTPISGSDTS